MQPRSVSREVVQMIFYILTVRAEDKYLIVIKYVRRSTYFLVQDRSLPKAGRICEMCVLPLLDESPVPFPINRFLQQERQPFSSSQQCFVQKSSSVISMFQDSVWIPAERGHFQYWSWNFGLHLHSGVEESVVHSFFRSGHKGQPVVIDSKYRETLAFHGWSK